MGIKFVIIKCRSVDLRRRSFQTQWYTNAEAARLLPVSKTTNSKFFIAKSHCIFTRRQNQRPWKLTATEWLFYHSPLTDLPQAKLHAVFVFNKQFVVAFFIVIYFVNIITQPRRFIWCLLVHQNRFQFLLS